MPVTNSQQRSHLPLLSGVSVTQVHTPTLTHKRRISCRHHKPSASLTEFSFPITSSDDLITFPFDAIHKNKRTLDGISLLSISGSVFLSPLLLPIIYLWQFRRLPVTLKFFLLSRDAEKHSSQCRLSGHICEGICSC